MFYNFIRKLHRTLFYLVLILLPTQFGRHYWPDFSLVNGIRIDYLAPTIYVTDLILLGMLGGWVFANISRNNRHWLKKFNKQDHYKFLIIVIVLATTNVLFAANPILSLIKWLTLLKLLFLILYIKHAKPDIKLSIYCLLFAGFYSSIIAWIQFITQSSIGGLLWFIGERTFDVSTPGIATAILNGKIFLRPYATFPHPNVLAGFIASIISLVLFIKSRNKFWQLAKIPLIVFMAATLFITYSRSAWIVMFLIVFILLVVKRNLIHKFHIVILILSFVLLTPFISERIFNLKTVDLQSVTRRIDLNKLAFEIVKDYPLFGVGLNNFIPILPSYASINSFQDLQPPHSIYILIFAETGIAGVLSVLFLLLLYFKKSILLIKNGLPISIFIILLLGLFDHYPYTINQIQLLLAVLVGFSMQVHLKKIN